MVSFKGTVEKIIFRSKDDEDYAILLLEDDLKKLTVKGHLPCVYYGFYLDGKGEVQHDEKYGDSILIKNVKVSLPTTKEHISFYCALLLSDEIEKAYYDEEQDTSFGEYLEFKNLSELTSELCEGLGSSVLDQIENNFDYVESFARRKNLYCGSSFFSLERMKGKYAIENDLRQIADELRAVNPSYAKFTRRLYQVFTYAHEINSQYDTAMESLRRNPYAFCFRQELPGYSFLVADAIAIKYKLPKDSYNRCCAGVKYVFYSRIASEGHVYASEEKILQESVKILKVRGDVLKSHLENMYQDRILIKETAERVYIKEYYDMEVFIAEKLVALNKQECEPDLISPDFNKIESQLNIGLSDEQKEAIKYAVNSKVSLITGGPGTGKTTIIRGIIEAFEDAGECSIMLAAPTGKAAIRLQESTQYDAQTIHRLLGLKPDTSREEVISITDGVIIIDEASMIDLDIMDKLMYSISPPVHLILVGDADQLPSVGPGYIFHDIIESNCFNPIKLTQIFRQEECSYIKRLAKNIISGEMNPPPIGESDYEFVPSEKMRDIKKKILDAIQKYLDRGYQKEDIQVLSPRKKLLCGTEDLNNLLQEFFNPGEKEGYSNNGEIIYSEDRV